MSFHSLDDSTSRRHFIASTTGALAAAAFLPVHADNAETKTKVKTKTVWGIAELWEWLWAKQQTTGHDSADCLQAHLDHGINHIMWALGRSTLDYHSALPTSTLYAGDPRPQTKIIGESLRKECSLRAALAFANKNDMVIYARLGMNRHYGDALGGALRSKYVADHPEWMERHRGGQIDGTKVSYAVPEYRAERVAILLEAAQIGAHGLCLDFCRQPPIARYHPLMVDPWLKEGREDPRKLSSGSPEFLAWAQHRCSFVNTFMRDLRAQLRKLEQTTNRKIPILARIPEATLALNLMEGLDLRTWLQEGLVDEIALNPLWIWDFDYPDTAKPYTELAKGHGVKVHGGANTVTGKGVKANARAFLERIARNYNDGADGIALFQTDASVLNPGLKTILGPLFPRLADRDAVSESLAAARAAHPQMTESERFFGLDNHSLLPQVGRNPRISLETI
jgi:hypothetical protein